MSTVNEYPINTIRYNLSLSFTFYRYCLNPVDMIYRIIKSRLYSISIISIHDLVPTIIKTKKYYNILRQNNFIRCSNRKNIINQIIEVNYVLYNNYFPLYTKHIKTGKMILNMFKNVKKIGVHVRLDDSCLASCKINIDNIYKIINISERLCKRKFVILLSSFSKNLSNLFKNIYKNVYTYNSKIDIKHSAKSFSITQYDIDKTILDIYLTSSSDILLLNGYSTYSLIILYKGYYSNYSMCKPKVYRFWNNRELYDHLERFRKRNNCLNITIP